MREKERREAWAEREAATTTSATSTTYNLLSRVGDDNVRYPIPSRRTSSSRIDLLSPTPVSWEPVSTATSKTTKKTTRRCPLR